MAKYNLSIVELEEYKVKLNIPNNHTIQQLSLNWEQRKGQVQIFLN